MALEDDFDFGLKPRTPSEQAYWYRSLGLQVWPHHHKQPIGMWGEFKNNLTPQPMFDGWYHPVTGKYRDSADMGVICGACSDGLMAIDLDLYKDKDSNVAANWWDGIKRLHNFDQDFDTWEAATGGGGRHIFFRLPPGVILGNIHSSINVDIKSQGGYIVLPPSSHPKGQYRWIRSPDDCELLTLTPELLEEITYLNHAYGAAHTGGAERTAPPDHEKTPFDSDIEGREWKLTRLTYHAVHELFRQLGDVPCPSEGRWEELFRPVWDKYRTTTLTRIPDVPNEEGLEREGRGYSAFMKKIRYLMRKWGSAQMKVAAARPNPNADSGDGGFDPGEFEQEAKKAGEQAKTNPSALYESLGMDDVEALPDPVWQLRDLMVEKSLGFIFGPPGSFKSTIALDIGASFAAGLGSWWGKMIGRHGTVIYISPEGVQDLKFRSMVWRRLRNVASNKIPIRFIQSSINFMSPADIGKLVATIDDIIAQKTNQPVVAIFVDTVSRAIPGADENKQQDMTKFIEHCDGLRKKFGTIVVGIHHVPRNGLTQMRGSTVMDGAADFIFGVEISEEDSYVGKLKSIKIKSGRNDISIPFIASVEQVPGRISETSVIVNPGRSGVKDEEVDLDTRMQILAALHLAHCQKYGWSPSNRSDRPAEKKIMSGWGLRREIAARLIEGWLRDGIIVVDTTGRSPVLKKVKDL